MHRSTPIFIILLFISAQTVFSQNILFAEDLKGLNQQISLEISLNDSIYKNDNGISVKYTLTNISTEDREILIKDYWGFPLGMTASIIDSTNTSICEHPSKHILSSQLFTSSQLTDDYIKLNPKESISGVVNLKDIPVFKSTILNEQIPSGKYTIQLAYISVYSNKMNLWVK